MNASAAPPGGKPLPNLAMDVGYTHLIFKDASINITGTSGNPWFNPAAPIAYTGNASVGVDIISLGFRYQFAPPPPPLMTKG